MSRINVDVIAKFDTIGNIKPLEIIWEDGRHFAVDYVLDIRPAASLKAGGLGIRYKVKILGKVRYLYLEDSIWFVEG